MTKQKYILSFDLGTSSLRAVLFDSKADIISSEQAEFTQHYPKQNCVEHDPEEIFEKLIKATKKLLKKNKLSASDIAGIGITNQRETTVIWDSRTGKPIYNAIVWQDTRTAKYCESLIKKGYSKTIRDKTGLIINSYFSASKINWILNNIVNKKDIPHLKFGTIDSWILWQLTKGKTHATDYSNASRTLLFNINTLTWDKQLLDIFNVTEKILPQVKPSDHNFGNTDRSIFGAEIPILAILGDQQSSLFGQLCFEKNDIKITYGTGCFILKNIGQKPILSKNNLLTTIAWGIDNKIFYAEEASIFNCASIINWLKNNLEIIKSGKEADELSNSVESSNDVIFIPAFSGLSAIYRTSDKSAEISGITLLTTKSHIVRAALESIAFQVKDVLQIIEKDLQKIKNLSVDGGISNSDFLMQLQSDLLNIPIKVQAECEKTACGVAFLAGIKAGLWNVNYLKSRTDYKIFKPAKNSGTATSYRKWQSALKNYLTV